MNSLKKGVPAAESDLFSEDTIAAISTPPGPGAIGMVRISGPNARSVGRKVFTPAREGVDPLPPRRAIFGHAHFPDLASDPIDLAVLTFFPGPGTYTGEDVVELTLHGGPLILGSFLAAVLDCGARLAEPGEFTRRAFLNGRMDLSQAEAVTSLIFASTEEARRVMLHQVEGAMGREAGDMRERLLEAKMLLEAAIDFPDEIEEADFGRISGCLEEIKKSAERVLGTARTGIALNEGFKVVIIGAPNVGKSSLLNAMLDEDRAIVHELAGTTRDYVEGSISIEGVPMKVVDTAGIRAAADPLESEGVRRTKGLIDKADALIVVLDSSRPLQPEEKALLEETRGAVRVVAANKADLTEGSGVGLPESSMKVSALKNTGIEDLKKAVYRAYIGDSPVPDPEKGVATTVRQTEALEKVVNGCIRARESVLEQAPPELVAVGVDEALSGLAELTGEVTTEEVLQRIFDRFCIGK